LAEQVVNELPEWVHEHLDNVSIVVQPWPSHHQLHTSGTPTDQTLLGLYEGVPLTRRGGGYHLVVPDRITLFQRPLELEAGDLETLRRLIARTVLHEIAHHFGFSEERLQSLGL
jgi:predicted Zn-dependent protease with MMP-like domain